ncbi:MAG TPA: hydroxymethylglutaryl-CoA lyase [Acidobacteriaceae bacterium]|jgi:hydroxymethylglutaryl-CoA lyase|nr:hydroxymethylglutaryl-CoA lyase [Acidobacteriaceae bacterium]
MNDEVKIIECPRDAWQGLNGIIPAEVKADYLRMLSGAGFAHIDAVSFVSPRAVPQMADSEQVLEYLDPPLPAEIIGIVVNERGATRAIEAPGVQTVGFPYSISPQFLERNQKQTPEEALEQLEFVHDVADGADLDVVVYISMAFGNPYGEPWSIGEVVAACDLLTDLGIAQVSLADTVGVATPQQISELVSAVRAAHPKTELGVHLHSRPGAAGARIRAAYEAGCRRFDSAVGGLGGCPFAQDLLVGNIATETLIAILTECGAKLPKLQPLDALIAANAQVVSAFGSSGRSVH